MATDTVGKVFQAEAGKRRCMICEQLFDRSDVAAHLTAPCETPIGFFDEVSVVYVQQSL